jgi:3-oxoacyl-[acyl-carrier protein] reductase
MDLSLVNRRAVVCGSTQGIGRAVAVELALLGAEVVLMARDRERLAAVAAELPASNGQGHSFAIADFAEPEQVRAAMEGALDPARPFHILINNTGGPAPGPVSEATPEQFLRALQMHVLSNHVLARLLLPGFMSERYGRIINIISTSVKAPIPGLGVSNTVRAAVANWAKTLAGEVAPFGITVNNVLPGFTDTARLAELFKSRAQKTGRSAQQVLSESVAGIPAGRLGRPEEIAAAVAFLATPAAAYINGTNITVDGGRTQSL